MALAFTLAILPVTGCIFDPPPDRPIPPDTTPYPILSTPENVLLAMKKAYQRRDSVEYASLFDSTYAGISTDQKNPGGTLVLRFYKADEQRHMGSLYLATSIYSVYFDLGNSLNRYDAGDAPWTTVQTTTARIEINGNPDSYSLNSTNEIIEFKFVPKTPAPNSPTDTTWKIIRWTEIHQ